MRCRTQRQRIKIMVSAEHGTLFHRGLPIDMLAGIQANKSRGADGCKAVPREARIAAATQARVGYCS